MKKHQQLKQQKPLPQKSFKSRGNKFNAGKPQFNLLPPEALEECAKVLTFGVKKYGRANWAKGIPISELIDATMRHINKFNKGIDCDEETKTLHITNACVNLMFAIWTMENKPEFDDRWIKGIKDVKCKDKKVTPRRKSSKVRKRK